MNNLATLPDRLDELERRLLRLDHIGIHDPDYKKTLRNQLLALVEIVREVLPLPEKCQND